MRLTREERAHLLILVPPHLPPRKRRDQAIPACVIIAASHYCLQTNRLVNVLFTSFLQFDSTCQQSLSFAFSILS